MKTTKVKIENIESLNQRIQMLKHECFNKEQLLKQKLDDVNNNKVKVLWRLVFGSNKKQANNKEWIEKVAVPAVISLLTTRGSVLTKILVLAAEQLIKNKGGKKLSQLFSKKGKRLTLNDLEAAAEEAPDQKSEVLTKY